MKSDRQPMGSRYWKGLDELAGTPEFRQWLHREFPVGATELESEDTGPVTLRSTLELGIMTQRCGRSA